MMRHGLLTVGGIERAGEVHKVIAGIEKADLALINATLLNVYTGEWLEDYSVTVKGEWIAYVGENPGDSIGPHTTVIDVKGKSLIPGFIDSHTHLAWLFEVSEFLRYAMPGGTTTIITETMEAFCVMGYEGTVAFLASLRDQPVKIFATAPAMASISKQARGISQEMLKELLSRDEIVGLGESYWQVVDQEPGDFLPIFEQTLRAGKRLEGHSAGAKGRKLMTYAASGVSSCHEPINADEALERLRLGMYVMIREGSIRSDLADISRIKDAGVDSRRLILVTDGVGPADLLEKGYMESVVQKAIDCGFDPATAIRMATLNVAEYFSLDGIVGGIAPGRNADMLVIPEPGIIAAECVISRGRIIAREGKLLISPRKHTFPLECLNSVRLAGALKPHDFSVPVSKGASAVDVRVIDLVTDLVTKETVISVPVVEGEIRTDTGEDILKVAAIDRRFFPGKTFVGLIRGFGLRAGAFATSGAWDTADIIVVGEDDADMAGAVNRVHALQGGAVVYARGEIMAEIPLPVMGLISYATTEILAQKVKELTKAVKDLGSPLDDPLLTIATLTGAAIPFLRICEEGLVNLRNGRTVGLVVD